MTADAGGAVGTAADDSQTVQAAVHSLSLMDKELASPLNIVCPLSSSCFMFENL